MSEFEEFNFSQFTREFEEQRLQKEFRDYLITREIAGTSKGFPKGSIIKSEFTIDDGSFVEVAKELPAPGEENEDEHTESLVFVRRNQQDEITSIEVQCTCGKKTIIRMDYEESEDMSSDFIPLGDAVSFGGVAGMPDTPEITEYLNKR